MRFADLLSSARAEQAAGNFYLAMSMAENCVVDGDGLPSSMVENAISIKIQCLLELSMKGQDKSLDKPVYWAALSALKSPSKYASKYVSFAIDYIRKSPVQLLTDNLGNLSQPISTYLDSSQQATSNIVQPLYSCASRSALPRNPLISILLPVYKVKCEYLISTISSVLLQTYKNWQLCIYFADVDSLANLTILRALSDFDDRISLREGENHGISGNSNICLESAKGEYVALLDHDDDLTFDALSTFVGYINSNPDALLLYSDKDSMTEDGKHLVNPLLKPDWSPEMLYSANYLTHLNVIKRVAIVKVGGFDTNTDGAQDWDLFLKVTELSSSVISIKKICYHWRIHPDSTSTGLKAKPYAHNGQLLAINNHLTRKFGRNQATARPNAYHGFKVDFSSSALHDSATIIFLYGSVDKNNSLAKLLRQSIDSGKQANYLIIMEDIADKKGIKSKLVQIFSGSDCSSKYKSLVMINSNLADVCMDDIDEVCQWTACHDEIAFCTGIIIDKNDRILDCGLAYDAKGTEFSPFFGMTIHDCGFFGSPMWYRNWKSCSGSFASIKLGANIQAQLNKIREEFLPSPEHLFSNLFYILTADGLRGMSNPHVILKDRSAHVSDYKKNRSQLCKVSPDSYYHPGLNPSNPNTIIEHVSTRHHASSATPADHNIVKPNSYFEDALLLAEAVDIHPNIINLNIQQPCEMALQISQRKAAWFLPDFGSAFYGGIMTILRLANYLREHDSIHNIFIVCGDVDIDLKKKMICEAFPQLQDSHFEVESRIQNQIDLSLIDYGIATLWTTAYVLAASQCRCKYYMIQDYEPEFYPAGSTYAQAELTYRFGFYGIANTESLAKLYSEKYNGKAICLRPAVDTSIFYPDNHIELGLPFRIFYYARPGTPRNCFEIACAAFKLIKSEFGMFVDIVCAGSGWNPLDYGLQDVVRCLGMLPYSETANLYRSCHIGISMMMTKHPSYLPLEMMACGTIVLANENPANEWLLRHNDNCLIFQPSKSCLAATIRHAINNMKALSRIRENGIRTIHDNHSSWDASLRHVADFMHSAGGSL